MTDAAQVNIPLLSSPAAPAQSTSTFNQPVRAESQQPTVTPHQEAAMDPQERRAHEMNEPAGREQPAAKPAPIKIGEAEYTPEELQGLADRKALEDVRKASLPTSADAYELKLPADFKTPEGVTFEFAVDDPVLGGVIKQAQAFAHANEFTQEQFSGMMALYAASQSHEQSLIGEARRAEIAKLGVNGPARVDAVSRWLRTTVGEDLANPMLSTLCTERHVSGFEKIIKRFSNQGGASWSTGGHRERPDSKPSNDEFSSWSFAQQREYHETGKWPGR